MTSVARRVSSFCLGILASFWSMDLAWADHGRFLFDAESIGDYDDFAWFSENPVEFNEDVICPEIGKIGELRFTYDTWIGKVPDSNPELFTGGGGLSGGFWASEDCALCDGYQWGFVQIVRSTLSGENEWNAPDGEWFPDTDDIQDVDYPFETLPELDNPPNPAPTIGFQDLPNRFFTDGNQFWQAELGLVCKNLATAEMKVVSTFLWGFDIVTQPIEDLGITPGPPGFFSDATPNYLNTLTSHFSGLNGSTQWQVERGCCCCIPEPSAMLLAGIGLIGLARIRSRREAVAA